MELQQLFSRALELHNSGQLVEAIAIYQMLLCLKPESSGTLGLMGTALTQKGDHEKAIRQLLRALALDPTHAATYSNLGIALKDSNRSEKALQVQKNGLVLEPALFDSLRNLAMTLSALKRPREAFALIKLAHQVGPERPEALSFKGVVLGALQRMDEAVHALKIAIILAPFDAEAHNNLGVSLLQIQKTTSALIITRRSLFIEPKNPEAWLGLGMALSQVDQNERALLAFDAAIALGPHLAPAYVARATSLGAQRNHNKAVIDLERAHQIDPAMAGALGQALYCRSKTLEWNSEQALIRQIKSEILDCKSINNPFPLLTRLDDPHLHLLAARTHARKAFPERENNESSWLGQTKGKIRIGYFTSDLIEVHPVFKNLHPLLQQHDRSRFEIFCFDISRSGEIVARDLFDEVVHVRSLSDREVAKIARKRTIDIAIDLNGYTEDARTDIFAARAAPIQINYLGYPGTMGSTFHDYIIADDYVIPRGKENFFTETVLRLPSFFMPYDLRANRSRNLPKVRREDYGLPEKGFIYCSFNDYHKITESTFHSWISILQQTDHSVLWLATRGDIGIHEIRARMKHAGIDSERIVEAHRVDSPEEHHARLTLADLMLDTFPYNSHTTACDAISVGLPLLTHAGTSFASRVSGSLLSKAGIPSLITSSISEYEARAIGLALDPQLYQTVRLAVETAADRMPSPELYARHLESLFEQLVRPSFSS